MSSPYYSLCECFEMLANTTIPQLLAEFPLAPLAANANSAASPGIASPLYVVRAETVAAADRLAAAAGSAAPQPYYYFAPGEAEVDAVPHAAASAVQPAQLELFASGALDTPAPGPALHK
jgi:hypothetical protein